MRSDANIDIINAGGQTVNKYGLSDRNIFMLYQDYRGDLTEYSSMPEDVVELVDSQHHDIPD